MLASLAYGVRRLAVVGAIVSASLVVLGVAWALWRGHPIAHAVAIFFYVGAVALLLAGTGAGGGARGGRVTSSKALLRQQQQKDAAFGDSMWLLLLALILGAAGYAVQAWL